MVETYGSPQSPFLFAGRWFEADAGYCLDDPVNNLDTTGLNPLLAWSQYIPAVNSIGKWVAEDVMTGGPGVLDALEKGVKKIPEAGKWYIDTVDSNLEKIQKGKNKKY